MDSMSTSMMEEVRAPSLSTFSHARRLLSLALMTLAGGAASALDWPYSDLLADFSSQVERCSNVSGFRFRNDTLPTTQQLARMCADPDCGNATSALMYSAIDTDSHVAAFTAFVVPVLNYCWYFRTPNDPCPDDPVNDYLTRVADKDANCERLVGISFRSNVSTTTRSQAMMKLTTSNTPCPSDCATLADRLSVLLDSMPCPRARMIEDHGSISIFSAWCRGLAPLPPYDKDVEKKMVGAAAVYSYQSDWPIPSANLSGGSNATGSQNSTQTKSGSSSATEVGSENETQRSNGPAPSEEQASTTSSSGAIAQSASIAVCCVLLLVAVWILYRRKRSGVNLAKDTDYATAGTPSLSTEGNPKTAPC